MSVGAPSCPHFDGTTAEPRAEQCEGCGSTFNLRVCTTCGALCTPCPVIANSTANCDGLNCGITCNANHRLCAGTCAPCPTDALSFSCSGTQCLAASCDGSRHVCSGQCVSKNSIASCGTSCTPCPAPPANATATCNGTSCGFSCNSGYVVCGTACCAA